jgi:hypothetical protein
MVARERKGTLQIFGDSNDSESRTGFFAGTRADRRGHGRVWSRHMCAGAEWLAARGLNRRRRLLQSAKLSLFAGVTNELLILEIYLRSASRGVAAGAGKLNLRHFEGSTCRSQPFQHPLKFYLHRARATDDEVARLAASPPD